MGGAPPKCLQCGSANVEKLLSPPPVIFKGSGFYKTDSGKKNEAIEGQMKAPEGQKKDKEGGAAKEGKLPKSGEEKPKSEGKKGLAKGAEAP